MEVVLLHVEQIEVAHRRGIQVVEHRMAAGPIAMGGGPSLQGHLDAVAGVEARAAHFGQIPAGAEELGTPAQVGVEAAGGDDHRRRAEHLAVLRIHPPQPIRAATQLTATGGIENLHTVL
ncbi:hypothetical protein D3C84_405470 [compost metagenome]